MAMIRVHAMDVIAEDQPALISAGNDQKRGCAIDLCSAASGLRLPAWRIGHTFAATNHHWQIGH
jgi:hypothetical protein